MSNELPPLPHPATNALMGDDFEDLYTADQMQEYGRARERAAYERAAKECERISDDYQYRERFKVPEFRTDADIVVSDCVLAIRALGADR